MNEIGENFKEARIDASVSLEEASEDTGISVIALEQIEAGNIGSFKDVFELRKNLEIYAKYLSLDGKKIIDDFNEYMFEYTSKIPVDDLEKEIETKEKEEAIKESMTNEIKVVSPYLKSQKNYVVLKYVITAIVIIILIAITLIWAINQVM